MKNVFLISVFFLGFMSTISSQKVYLELKSEFNKSIMKFNWDSDLGKSFKTSKSTANFSIGASTNIYKYLFIKTTIGTADFTARVRKNWTSHQTNDLFGDPTPFDTEHELYGIYTISQNFFEVLPEIRFLKDDWLFINAGVGVFSIRSNIFHNGYYHKSRYYPYKIQDYPRFTGSYTYFAFNIGFNQKATEKLGISGEIGVKISAKTKKELDIPGIGVNQQIAKVGIVYILN